jgi:fused signal recognition particle receptor
MLGFLKKALEKTSENIHETVHKKKSRISREELEEILLEADAGYDLIERLVEGMPETINRSQAFNSLVSVFHYRAHWIDPDSTAPFVEMIIGVNGAGKTTTIAKLAHLYSKEGKSVILGAGDTFRAAAIEQLKKWAEKLNLPIVSTRQGHDPSAVVYDTVKSAVAKKIDRVIIDTAGRLHTQINLAEELKKMVRVADKALPGAPHRKMLVLDGTQGSSAVNQARVFNEMIGIDGIIITKLDGTAKGGAILSIADELKLPIYYIGTGETAEDLIRFKADEYINTILDVIFRQ